MRLLPCLLLLLASVAAAPWRVAPDGATGLELLHNDAPPVSLNIVCWGPNWKWFEFPGAARATAAVRTFQSTCPVPDSPAKLSLDYKARQSAPDSVELSYALTATQAVDLTGVALIFKPPQASALTATYTDNTTQPLDPAKTLEIPKPLRALSFTLPDKQTLTLAFATPRPVHTFNDELRIWLALKHLDAGSPVNTTLTLTFPAAATFYARDADAATRDITPEWFPYNVAATGTPVDLSFLNKDKDGKYVPAGAHGFLGVKGDSFVFADGTPARFWGVNVTAFAALGPFPRSAEIAQRLARLGVNVVRLHHLDSDWGPDIIDIKARDHTTQHLNPANMQRLDRLIFELKQRGIYVILDPWVGRGFLPGDDVPGFDTLGKGNFGLHPYIFFDRRMRELHKKFLREFWTHTNEFTHLAYKDDPAVATTECANEFLFHVSPDMPEPYKTEFLNLYHKWCDAHHESPSGAGDILRLNYPLQHQRFYQDLMRDFFADIHDYLKNDVGLRIPINYSNWFHFPWEIGAQAGGDFMDAHHYYNGNRIGPTAALGGLWVENPLVNPDSPFAPIAAMAILGKPLTSSECGANPPQTYRSAYYLGLASVACLQGWDSLTPYAYTQSPEPAGHLGPFEFESDPATVASLAAAALIYRRGDVSPARQSAVLLLPKDEQYAMHWEHDYAKAHDHTALFRAYLETHKLSIVLADAVPPDAPKPDITFTMQDAWNYQHPDTQLLSDTKELWRDWSLGVGLINTPRTQAAFGRLSKTPISTTDCSFSTATPFATLSLSSLTDAPIKSSDHLLLTVAARAEDSNQTFNLSHTKIVTAGKGPVLCEPVVGTVTFATGATHLNAYPLLPTGVRGPAMPLAIKDGKAVVPLAADAKTIFYEVAP